MSVVDIKKQERIIEIDKKYVKNDDMSTRRYFIAELVKKALDKYLDYDDMSASNIYSLYTLPTVNEDLNIIDFEINSLSVHVIPTVDRAKNERVYIPYIYKQFHYKPDMFLFVNFTKALAKMEILGFVTNFEFNSLAISKENLNSTDNLIDTLKRLKPIKEKVSQNIIDTTQELMLAYIDNDLSDDGKRFFLKNILSSKEIRKNYKLFCSINTTFQTISKKAEFNIENPFDEGQNDDIQYEETDIENTTTTYNNDNMPYISPEEPVNIEDNGNNTLESETDDIVSVQDDFQEEKVLELSLDTITYPDEENATENIADEEYSDENQQFNIENETDDELQEYENDDIFDGTRNEEIEEIQVADSTENDNNSVDNDEIIDLAQSNFDDDFAMNLHGDDSEVVIERIKTENYHEQADEPEILPVDISQQELLQNQEDTTEQITSDDDLLEIAVDSETDTSDFVNDIQLEQDSAPQNEIQLQNNEADNEEDLFSFLSEIADEGNTNEQNIQLQNDVPVGNTSADQPSLEENFDTINSNVQENQNTIDLTQPDFSQFSAENNQQEQDENTTQPAQKNNAKRPNPVLIAALICVSFACIYKYKDPILSMFNSNQEVQGIATEDSTTASDESVPPPISADLLDKNAANTETSTQEEPTAPPPSTTATTQKTNDDNVPPVAQAPQLPNAPTGTTTVEPPKPKHLNDAIATALSKDFSGVRISKISWQASETLLKNPDVKRYLTIAGKSVKNSLSQDLMAATEPSFKDTVTACITYKKNGSVAKVEITSSSGSKQIDDIIVKSIKDTLNYVKMPALNLNTAEYTAKIIIRL